MGKWQIWHKDGSKVKDDGGSDMLLPGLTYSGEWMGACNVTCSWRGGVPVSGLAIGDWLEYRGERFELNYAPGVKKKSGREKHGEGFCYDDMRFDALQNELVRCDFTDMVLGDNGQHWTGLSQFSFYVETLDALLDRIQACLDDLYGKGVWRLYSRNRERSLARGCSADEWDAAYGGKSEKTTVDGTTVSASDETCWDALCKVNSEWNVNFVVRNRNVYVGTAGKATGSIFRYGKGKGLGSIEKTADSEQYVVTRLKAYGSSKNLPDHYYADLGDSLPNNMAVNRLMLPGFPSQSLQDYWDSLTDAEKKWVNPGGREHRFSGDAHKPWIESLNADVLGVRPASVMFDSEDKKNGITEIYPTIEEMTVGGVRVDVIDEGSMVADDGRFDDGADVGNVDVWLRKELDIDLNEVREDDFTLGMKDGACGGRTFKIQGCKKEDDGRWRLTIGREKDDATGLWFPYKDYQIKSGDHIVLTGMKMPKEYVDANALRLLKWAIAYLDENDYTKYTYTPEVDEIYMARQHDAAMQDETGATRSLHDTLKEGDLMMFEDEDLGITGSVTISQLTIKEEDGKIPTYEVTLREDKEVGRMEKMQGQIDSIASGNGFAQGVSLGLTTAQVRSIVESEGGKHFLSKTKKDTAGEEITFAKGLTAGTFATGVSGAKVDGEGRAEVETLAVRGRADVGGNLTVDGSLAVGDGYGIGADGHATLGEADVTGVRSHGATEGDRVLVGGKGFELYRDAEGKSHLWVDNAMIRGRLVASETEIRKVSYSGGTLLLSSAGSRLVRVRALNTRGVFAGEGETAVAYKCWAAADDGTTQTMNWWKAGDMALCKTMNVSGTSGGNRYYWRMVLATGQEVLEDGRLYDYVVLSNLEKFGGTDTVCPVNVTGTLATADGTVLTWGGMAVSVVSGVEMTSFAEVVKAHLSTDTDDDGNAVADREFYGFDPTGTSVPQEGDVIVQAGNEVAAVRRGGVIKLATSADDADARTTPSLTMYHAVGRLRASGTGGKSVWQWKTVTAELSPVRSYVNSDYFLFFTGDELSEKTAFSVADKLDKVDETFDSMLNDIADVNGRVDTTDDNVKTISGRVSALSLSQDRIAARVEQVETSYDKVSGRVEAVEKQTSEIRQTATEIALGVSRAAVGKTNLFVGSALRRQGEGAMWYPANGSGLSVSQGYNGTNALMAVVACPGGTQQWAILSNGNSGTADAPNIRIPRKGASYTFSFLARGDDGMTVAIEAFYKAGAKDGSTLRKDRLGYRSVTFAGGSGREWVLLTFTAEVPVGASCDYMEVCLSATHKEADAVKTAYLCRPMVAEADGYYGWGWSEKDYSYIGGNMLDGTRYLATGGNLSGVQGFVTDNGYGPCSTVEATGTDESGLDMLMWNLAGKLTVGRDYTFSFMARGDGTVRCFMFGGGDGAMMYTETGGRVRRQGDGMAENTLSGVWTRHTVHWRNTGTVENTTVLVRVMYGSTAELAQPKLEEGATATDWTEAADTYTADRSLGAQLYTTGIDIKNGVIDMTADKFTLRNNSGERSFDVDEHGDLTARSLRSVTKDGLLEVLIAAGAFRATTSQSGASAFFGLLDGVPCLQFTNAAGVVTYAIGASGAVVDPGGGITVTAVSGTAQVTDGTDTGGNAVWTVLYQVSATIRNTSQQTVTVTKASLRLAVNGFAGKTEREPQFSSAVVGGDSVILLPAGSEGAERSVSFGTWSETVRKQNADGSHNSKPQGTVSCSVAYNGKTVGYGQITIND